MKKLTALLASILLALALSGCSEKVRVIKPKMPHLQTWEVAPLENIEYEVYDENG